MGESRLWRLGLSLVLGLWAQGAKAQDSLRVGVRVDAAPFAYKTPEGEYAGFVFELCTYALKAARLDYTAQDANVDRRLPGLIRVEGRPREYDVLCDPTSITLSRARDYVLSAPVFVSGGSFLHSGKADQALLGEANRTLEVRPAVAVDGARFETRSTYALESTPQTNVPDCTELPEGAIIGARLGYVRETTGRKVIDRAWSSGAPPIHLAHFQTICAKPYPSHADAVEALCRGDEISYHFGDRDIIDYYRRKILETDPSCDATTHDLSFTSEPYAIVISPELDPKIARSITAGVLEALGSGVKTENDPEQVVALPNYLFAKYFPDRRMSEALHQLYTVMRVPE
ncbi:ABC transporter substrate-binding protein [uncultured Roseovarius sp.]|uniref:substrate-binding periplasmic protein n=1 Tax=uncultured Roseovarius sp. TaxID=293344 RepID=UPI00260F7E4E|nr:transporter substrate-binding domain-containing protein [uncultured Roseovarius sp.]